MRDTARRPDTRSVLRNIQDRPFETKTKTSGLKTKTKTGKIGLECSRDQDRGLEDYIPSDNLTRTTKRQNTQITQNNTTQKGP